MSRTVAALDCGTNTLKLLVGRFHGGGAGRDPELEVLVRETRMVRLGQDLDRTGRISEAALERAFTALDEYAALLERHGVSRVRFCATSATRDATNRGVFAAGVRERLGVEPEVVTGAEEAALAFDGAVGHLREPAEPPVLVLDIGGGSTELVLGEPGGAAPVAHSMDIGSVRLHERHLHDDPPTSAQVAACVAEVDRHLDASPVSPADAATVVGVAGTALTVVAGVLGLPAYDRDVIDQSVVGVDAVHATTARLVGMTVAERLELGYMHPGRADVIDAGAIILDRVLRRTRPGTMVASEADILDGIARSLAPGV